MENYKKFDLSQTLAEVCNRIDTLLMQKKRVVVAIDGRAASGKSTAAEYLSQMYGASVVHADDFFLPLDIRTESRLSEPGGNIHYERLLEEVISRLSSEHVISYGVFDCSKGCVSRRSIVNTNGVLIIEGAYSMHPKLGNYYDFSVFMTAAQDVRLERVTLRSDKKKAQVFKERWMPMEEKYIKEFKVESSADIVISTDIM